MTKKETLKNLPLLDARARLGEIVQLARYTNQQFRLTRNNRPMARVVGEPFMQALETLMESDPALAETIEIMMDKEMMEAIDQGMEEIRQGVPLRPLEDVLKS